MELIKLNLNVRCDMGLCRNKAEYSIAGAARAHLPWRREAGGIYICHDCLVKLYETLAKVIVPKSPDNLVKKAIKRREKDEKN